MEFECNRCSDQFKYSDRREHLTGAECCLKACPTGCNEPLSPTITALRQHLINECPKVRRDANKFFENFETRVKKEASLDAYLALGKIDGLAFGEK